MTALAAMLAIYGCHIGCQSGMIAVMEPESGLRADAVGPFGAGLPQWVGSRRRRAARKCGFTPDAGACQVRLIVRELDEFGIRDELFAMTDPAKAARLFFTRYEMPGASIPRARVQRAREIYEELRR